MILVSVADHYTTRTFSFAKDEIVIGNAPDVDLVLDVDKIAPRHIRAIARDGTIVVEDLRPRGAQPPRTLAPRDIVKIAGVTLRIELRRLEPEQVSDEVEQRMLAAIGDRPDDDETREVYADWLEGDGQAAKAEFVRTQLTLRHIATAADPAFAVAAKRLAELSTQLGAGWRARVAMAFLEGCPAKGKRPGLGFELVCPMRWDKLEPTATHGVRTCRTCSQTVTYCQSIEHARTLAQAGGCIAVDLGVARSPYDLDAPMVMGRPSPPMSRYGRRSS